jgi:leucyl aminopeptidase (aminopeptidase T)
MMSDTAPLLKGAHKIVRDCAHIRPGEKVLVITDTGRDLAIACALMQEIMTIPAECTLCIMEERSSPGEEPPPQVHAAMVTSDVILQATTTVMAFTQAKKEACERGARMAAMTGIVPEILISPALLRTDFEKELQTIEKVGEKVRKARHAKITTPAGTNLEMSLEGRNPDSCTSLLDSPGRLTGLPNLEVYIAPIESSVNGVAVIDGTLSSSGLVSHPVTLTIKNGIVQKIEGKEDAKTLQKLLEDQKDPHVYQVAELGIGLNPNAQLRGAIIEDEGALGTAHIALGDNLTFGGKNKAPVHIDMVMKDPIIELDGKKMLERRTLYF